MAKSDRFSRSVNEFHGRLSPEPLRTAGYAALIDHYALRVPLPGRLTGIAERHHRSETNDWQLLTPRHAPSDDLRGHLEFALKWAGVDLGVLSAIFRKVSTVERGKSSGARMRTS